MRARRLGRVCSLLALPPSAHTQRVVRTTNPQAAVSCAIPPSVVTHSPPRQTLVPGRNRLNRQPSSKRCWSRVVENLPVPGVRARHTRRRAFAKFSGVALDPCMTLTDLLAHDARADWILFPAPLGGMVSRFKRLDCSQACFIA